MIRLLVLSDSHGDIFSLKTAIEENSDSDAVIFLGDGIKDFEKVSDSLIGKDFYAVRGNCDSSFCDYPENITALFGETRVYLTHGYKEFVKHSLNELKNTAKSKNASLALYGHTHTPFTAYENGLYIMNPGSVKENSCGIADITDNGILCFTKKIITAY